MKVKIRKFLKNIMLPAQETVKLLTCCIITKNPSDFSEGFPTFIFQLLVNDIIQTIKRALGYYVTRCI